MPEIGRLPEVITGLVPVLSLAQNTTLTTRQVRGHFIRVTAAATIKLPPVTQGALLTIYSTTAAAISVDPDDADRIVLDGAAGGDGKKITSESAAGDYITLIGDSAAGWTMIGRSGAWTMES